MPAIVQKVLPAGLNHTTGRPGGVDLIVIHRTEGNAASVVSHFNNPKSKVSSHYMAQRDGVIVQFVDEQDTAWANGRVLRPTAALVLERTGRNPNEYSISIECEASGDQDLTEPQRASVVALIADICARYRIPLDRRHVVGHHEIFADKTCPAPISVDRLVADARAESKPEKSTPAPVIPQGSESYAPRYSPTLGWIIPITVEDDHTWSFVTVTAVRAAIRTGLGTAPITAGTTLSSLPRASHEMPDTPAADNAL